MKLTKKKKRGLSAQINLLIVIGILTASVITFLSQTKVSDDANRLNLGKRASEAAREMTFAIKEYPAYQWLLSYWYEHADSLDVEYDVDFAGGSATREKVVLFNERHPDLPIHYLDQETVEALPESDQKLYAEIAYSWILTRVNEIKLSHECDYLFLVATDAKESDHPFQTQFFLMSGADSDSSRGTSYEEIYTLGVMVSLPEDSGILESMRRAAEAFSEEKSSSKTVSLKDLVDAGNYLDYYECLDLIGDQAYLAGVTFSLKDLTFQIFIDTLKSTLLAAGYQILLLGLVIHHVLFYVIHPLKKILLSIRMYTKTRDSMAVSQDMSAILSWNKGMAIRENEIGQLAEDFSDLTKEIDDYVEQIRTVTAQQERYRAELNIAAQIQSQVLPDRFPDRPEFDLYAMMTPAREVGGDFYDFYFVSQNHLALVIGDVSDKGVPAALFMMITKTLIKDHAKMGETPSGILSHVNDRLCENNKAGYFVTVWFALIDLKTGEGISVNAGHEHPATCRADGSYELFRYKHSPVIGLFPGIEYKENRFLMKPGDRLFVYTDGVPEAHNKDDEQFDTDRMLEVLNRNRKAQPKELLIRMREEIDAFSGEVPQFDDITMLYFQYKCSMDAATCSAPKDKKNESV